MRKWLVGAVVLAGAGGTALAQNGQAQNGQAATHWTYLVEKFGTIGWEDGDVDRDGALNTVSTLQVLYFYTPQRIPADATRAFGFEKQGETYDYELRIVTYSCAHSVMRIENSNMYKYRLGEMPVVAGGGPQPERRVGGETDQKVKSHLCAGVKPEGAREAEDVGQVVKAARAKTS